MPNGDVETFHRDGMWRNRIEGSDTLPGKYDTKEQAVQAGRDVAIREGVEHIIRNVNGEIGERNTYGNDPRNIKG